MFKKLLHVRKAAEIFLLMVWTGAVSASSNPIVPGDTNTNENAYTSSSGLEDSQNSEVLSQIERLHKDDSYDRQRAAIALGNLGNAQAVEPLIKALGDEDDFVRNFAARSLGELGDSRAVEPLIRAMQDENLLVRRSAVTALGHLGDSKAVDPLMKAINGEDDLVRRAAVEALGNLGDARGIEPLITALGDNDIFIRDGAAVALENMGSLALPKLVTVLRDWNLGPRVREVLKQLNWQPSTDEEKIWFAIAARDRQSLLNNWETAKKVLFDETRSGDARQIQNVVYVLISIGQDETIGELVDILEEKGTVTMVKAFQNSGNNTLLEAANSWSLENKADTDITNLIPTVKWGSMQSL